MRRPAIRPKPPRGTKRVRPRIIKGLMRVCVGSEIVYLAAGTNKAYKYSRDDVETIENIGRKMIEEMSEDELKKIIEENSMSSLPLSEDEVLIVQLASKYVLAGYFIMKA